MKTRRIANTAKSRALAADWEALCAKYDAVPKFARTTTTVADKGRSGSADLGQYLAAPARDPGKQGQSLITGGLGWSTKAKTSRYTGTKVLGVAVMHKSSMVPVFSEEEAVDIAKMRRS